jgi:hypothetical protein
MVGKYVIPFIAYGDQDGIACVLCHRAEIGFAFLQLLACALALADLYG